MTEEIRESTSNFYANIPLYILGDNSLSPYARILYGLISSLSNVKGYCWASNKYLADFLGVSKTSVSLWIKSLKEAGYIIVELDYKDDSKEVDMRKIWTIKPELRSNNPTNNNTPSNSDKEDKPEKEEKYKDEIKEIIDYLNEIADCKYRYTSEGNNKLIRARLNEGYSVDDFKRVIDNKVSDWMGTDWQKFIRPATLFSTGHFDQYLNQKNYISPQNQVSSQNQVSRKEFERLKETTKAY